MALSAALRSSPPVKDLRLWLGLLALFVTGICVGALGTWIFAEQRVIESFTHEEPPFHRAIMRKLTRALDLDQAQRERVGKIVCSTQGELRALRERIRPERDEIIKRSREAIIVELSPEQQTKLQEIYRRMEERRGRRGHGGRRRSDSCE
jgi:hypothetical protein